MAIGTTIDGLNSVTSLTAQDEVPVWDKEASGEPTKKITAQNMANSVKSLASLPNTTEMNAAIAQSTAIERMNIISGATLNSNQRIEIVADIKDLKSQYSIVQFLNFEGVAGTNYNDFGFLFAYSSGNTWRIGIMNYATTNQTVNSIDVSFLCIK